MTWSLLVFIAVISSGVLEGTVVGTKMNFERCMAKAVSMRFGDVSGQQFICWPEAEVETRHG